MAMKIDPIYVRYERRWNEPAGKAIYRLCRSRIIDLRQFLGDYLGASAVCNECIWRLFSALVYFTTANNIVVINGCVKLFVFEKRKIPRRAVFRRIEAHTRDTGRVERPMRVFYVLLFFAIFNILNSCEHKSDFSWLSTNFP